MSGLPTRGEFERVLHRHVLDPWFPRSIDREAGGFLCDFDYAWRPRGMHEKLLEFQARQTWVAADASRTWPEDVRFRGAAEHGFRFLREVQWDRDAGGWFHRLARSGRPLQSGTKHVHGTAYAIAACAAVHAATGDPATLDLAREGFEWLDAHARDPRHGGYLGFLTREGSPITDPATWSSPLDPIQTPIGLKDLNVHSDLFETLLLLRGALRDPRVEERASELLEILCTRFRASEGVLHYVVRADWTPVPHPMQFGNQLQTAFRFDLAGEILGDRERLAPLARRLVHEALRLGWDHGEGGVFNAGPGTAAATLGLLRPLRRAKSWWPQVEALRALVRLLQRDPEDEASRRALAGVWSYLGRHVIDERRGGFHAMGLDTLPRWRRPLGLRSAPGRFTRKGEVWKDASHEGRALLYAVAATA